MVFVIPAEAGIQPWSWSPWTRASAGVTFYAPQNYLDEALALAGRGLVSIKCATASPFSKGGLRGIFGDDHGKSPCPT
jgi:hypothetical protein